MGYRMNLIFLNRPEARSFFLEHGFVYTLREPRSTARFGYAHVWRPTLATRTWASVTCSWSSSEVNDCVLDRYVPESGFKNVWSWRAAVKKTIPSKFLYLLTRTRAT